MSPVCWIFFDEPPLLAVSFKPIKKFKKIKIEDVLKLGEILSKIINRKACYEGILLAPAEGFGL